jgi:glycosyltransferase involved in cell wall biosynthesis
MRAGKVTVAFLIDRISGGRAGTEKQLLEMLKRLDRSEFQPVLICLYSTPWLEENAASLAYRVYSLGFRGFLKLNLPAVLYRLAQVVKQEKIRVLHTFFQDSIFVSFIVSFLVHQQPALAVWRRDVGLGDEPWYHFLYNILMPLLHWRFRAVLTNSSNVKEYVKQTWKVPPKKIQVIYNGIEIPITRRQSNPSLCQFATKLRVGIVANLRAVKRIDLLLRALYILRVDHGMEDIMAVVIGGGDRGPLESLARELQLTESIIFLGSVKDVVPYLQNVDVGVLCSAREGLSNALMEYMACGLPVVATAVGGNPELVDLSNGILVPPNDARALSDALAQLARNPELRRRMGLCSLEKIKERFSWEKTMVEIQSVCRKLAHAE